MPKMPMRLLSSLVPGFLPHKPPTQTMKTPFLIILGSCVLSVFSCAPSARELSGAVEKPYIYSQPQDSLCRIIGRVTEVGSEQPVLGANVFTVGASHGTVSDDSGTFSMRGLPAGTYRIRTTSIGHEPVESVEFVLKPNDTAILNMKLLPKKPVLLPEQ